MAKFSNDILVADAKREFDLREAANKIEIETQTLLLEGTLIFLGNVALKVYF